MSLTNVALIFNFASIVHFNISEIKTKKSLKFNDRLILMGYPIATPILLSCNEKTVKKLKLPRNCILFNFSILTNFLFAIQKVVHDSKAL